MLQPYVLEPGFVFQLGKHDSHVWFAGKVIENSGLGMSWFDSASDHRNN